MPPQDGCYKLNVDGALFADLERAGVGFILRDARGKAILRASLCEEHVDNPITIEALAILRGLQHSLTQGFTHILVESDCQLVVNEMLNAENSSSEMGNIYLDVKDLMSRFRDFSLHFASRLCNIAAHRLARNSWHVNQAVLWHGDMLDFLTQTVWFDNLDL